MTDNKEQINRTVMASSEGKISWERKQIVQMRKSIYDSMWF